MPRPFRPLAWGVPALALAAAFPPAAVHGALAAAAGGLFEAAPFVLAAALVPGARLRVLAPLLGCGCGGRLPAALALPSLALCWFAFGPIPTTLRVASAVLLAIRARHAGLDPERGAEADPLADLVRLGLASFAAALLAESLRALAAPAAGPLAALLAFALGLGAGALAPCGTAGIGAAMALRTASPFAAAGLLVTSGMFVLRRPSSGGEAHGARAAFALLALACALFFVRGTHGFLNPRLWFVAPLGAIGAAACTLRGTRSAARYAYAAPLVMLIALAAGSPAPLPQRATIPYDLYPGRELEFTGTVAPRAGARATTLVRFAILCCRADAEPLSLELDRRLDARPGAWVRVHGVAIERDAQMMLRVESAVKVDAPADPFLYL
jgi:hypothetical protein